MTISNTRSMILLALAAAAIASPATAQRYYARERLQITTSQSDTPPASTPTPTPSVVISCTTRAYQYWANNYNSRPVESIARVGPGVNAEKLCQDYASSRQSTGVCAVSTASADPNNPSSGYMMLFYPGDSTLFKDGPAFASEYAMSCTKK